MSSANESKRGQAQWPPRPSAELEAILAEVDWEQLHASVGLRRLLSPPLLAVVDTAFVFTALQSQLRQARLPLSIHAAEEGGLRLLIAAETLAEVYRKLPDFAAKLGTTRDHLNALVGSWSKLVVVVDVARVTPDGPASRVAERDPTDTATATLASLLAPCLLLTTDNDFQALGVIERGGPVVAVTATLAVNDTTVRVNGLVVVPTLPVVGVAAAVRWIGERSGIPPLLVAAMLAGGGIVLYRRISEPGRAQLHRTLGQMGLLYLEDMAKAFVAQQTAIADLQRRIVPPVMPRSAESVVLRELGRAGEALSAQTLWDRLDPEGRPSITTIRGTLRRSTAVVAAGSGRWTLGLGLDELRRSSQPR